MDAFRRPDPSLDGRELKVVDLLDRATAKLDVEFTGSSRSKGALLDALGRTYTGLGLSAKSVDVHLLAVGALEAALGPEHRDGLSRPKQPRLGLSVRWPGGGGDPPA